MMNRISYSEAIKEAFTYLLENHEEVFIIGQGLWSPWYVGNTMNDLEKKYGKKRIIDTPVSESAVTGAAVGSAISGMRPIVVHPRVDFMLYAMDAIVNQAAKWRHMTGGQATVPLTIRAIINRGGEQGAQHSQALHSWFCHIPGIKVVMPYSPNDARDLLIASVLDNNPVIYHDDRWLYENESEYKKPKIEKLSKIKPNIVKKGKDITIIGSGFTTHLSLKAAREVEKRLSISSEVIDLRIINPIDYDLIFNSVRKTKKLLVVDGAWATCGISAEIISKIALDHHTYRDIERVERITLPFAPAPTASILEEKYYIKTQDIESAIESICTKKIKNL